MEFIRPPTYIPDVDEPEPAPSGYLAGCHFLKEFVLMGAGIGYFACIFFINLLNRAGATTHE